MATKSRSKSRTNNSKPFTILGDTLESAAESFEEATVNANHSAKRAAQATKRALTTGVFKTFYGVSYGLVYSGVFLTELLPKGNMVRRALTEGAESALRSREKARLNSKSKKSLNKAKHVDEKTQVEPEVMAAASKPKRARSGVKVPSRARRTVESRADKFDDAMAEAAASA